MNRYQILEKEIPKVKSFLKNGKTEGVPNWALKNKDKLEKQLKGVKNSAKTQGFIGKTQDFTKSRT